MAATIRDIKEQTGLSLATISKYLNGGNVLPENRVLIETAIKELHYEVNEIARGLVTNKTRTVGVLVYRIDSLFNGTLLRYISDALRRRGYGLLICDSDDNEELEAENVRFLLSKKVDGIIVTPVAKKVDFLNSAKKSGVPIVLLDRKLQDSDLDCVKIDNRAAAFKAVMFLIENNHKRIAAICSDETEYAGFERYKGYADAMEQSGFDIPAEYVKKGKHSIEHGYESMRQLLQLENPPTAVFMSNYEITLGGVMAVNESEFRCPEDISMIGFDNLIMDRVVKPKMYMVVQPMKEMGERAVELLLRRIDSKEREEELPTVLSLGTKIQEGNSVMRI